MGGRCAARCCSRRTGEHRSPSGRHDAAPGRHAIQHRATGATHIRRRATGGTRNHRHAASPSAERCCSHPSEAHWRPSGRRVAARGHRTSARPNGRLVADATRSRPHEADGTRSRRPAELHRRTGRPERGATDIRRPAADGSRSRRRGNGRCAEHCCIHRNAAAHPLTGRLGGGCGRHVAGATRTRHLAVDGARSHRTWEHRQQGGRPDVVDHRRDGRLLDRREEDATGSRPHEGGETRSLRRGTDLHAERCCTHPSGEVLQRSGRPDEGRGRHAGGETRTRPRGVAPCAVRCCSHRIAVHRRRDGRRVAHHDRPTNARRHGRHEAVETHSRHESARHEPRRRTHQNEVLRRECGRPDGRRGWNGRHRDRRVQGDRTGSLAHLRTATCRQSGRRRGSVDHRTRGMPRSPRRPGPRQLRLGHHPCCRSRGPGRCSSVLGRRSRGLLHQV